MKNMLHHRNSAIVLWRTELDLLPPSRDLILMRSFGICCLFLLFAPAVWAEQLPNAAGAATSQPKIAPKLFEPKLNISRRAAQGASPRVALTFDACMGQADLRILSMLVENKIPSTVFVTARWLKNNAEAIRVFLAHPDLFEIENHGENHIPAVDQPIRIYGIAAAGSSMAVEREVAAGAAAVQAVGFSRPVWFRGATAKYDETAIRQIRQMGYKIAGFSLNGDGGSLLGAAVAEMKIAAAKDGDVVIAHINQPTHEAGAGVVRGILALKARGAEFVRLADVEGVGDAGTTR